LKFGGEFDEDRLRSWSYDTDPWNIFDHSFHTCYSGKKYQCGSVKHLFRAFWGAHTRYYYLDGNRSRESKLGVTHEQRQRAESAERSLADLIAALESMETYATITRSGMDARVVDCHLSSDVTAALRAAKGEV
jgi:hypothetical protein